MHYTYYNGQTVTYTCADYVTCACLRHLYMQELLLRHLYMHTPFGWGGWGGWDDNVLGLAHIVVYGCGGMGGVGGMITFLGLAHIIVYGCGGMGGVGGMSGVGGMITFLGLAHIVVYGCGGMGGVGGWDDNFPWTCTHSSLQIGRWGVGLAGLGNLYFMYAVTYT